MIKNPFKQNKKNLLGPNVDFDGNGWEAEININGNVMSEDLFARKIWQALYRPYLYFGDPGYWDSFLCDLTAWAHIISEEWKKGNDFVRFYWMVNGDGYTTNSFDDEWYRDSDVFEIIVDTRTIGEKKITIKKRLCQIVP